MKIALTGASGTGKTTLANHISKMLNIPYVQSTARSIAEEQNIQPEQINSKDDLIQFQIKVITKKLQTEEQYKSFITDRAYIDSICYVLNKHYLFDESDYKSFIIPYYTRCLQLTNKTYDWVIRLPIGIELKTDNIRKTNQVSNMVLDIINQYFFSLLQNHKISIPIVQLINRSQTCAKEIIHMLNSF